jgi:small subunit ribosomal protein S28e
MPKAEENEKAAIENTTANVPEKAVKHEEQRPAGTGDDKLFEGWLAQVVDVVHGRTGIYGEIKQAMCKIMEGKDKGRVIRRNIAGKIKKGDIIRLPDTSREDKKIMAR